MGSLGLFLFGMKLMGDGLQKISGEKLRAVMRSMTGNRFKGVLSGTLVTTAVQSSSVTTVMVVGFVNASLLTLREAIGVIMGANLGTTTTAWVIALLGFRFSLADIALPIVGVGVALSFMKKPSVKDFGEFLVGFGILFMGLDFLKNAVPDIQAHPEWMMWVTDISKLGFWSVLLFLCIGILLTIVVQASSVTMAITITMAAKGLITFDLAAAIVLGENIGTTITANLAALQASWNAKRAAIAHLVFNVIGSIWALVFFYWFVDLIYWIVPVPASISPEMAVSLGVANVASLSPEQYSDLLARAAVPDRLALFHTLFNFLNICLLIGFIPQIERLTCWVLKDSVDRKRRTSVQRLAYLTTNLPDMGELALIEGQKELVKLSELSGEMFKGFVHVIQNPDKDLSDEVGRLRDLEQESDKLSVALTNFFVQCSSHELSQSSLKMITRNLIVVPELEEMCDSCYRLITLARKRYRRQFFEQIWQSTAFAEFCAQMSTFVEFAENSLLNEKLITPPTLDASLKMRGRLDHVRKALRREAIAQMESKGVTRGGILFIEILSACERVNSHAMNILEAMNPKSADID